MKDRGTFTAFKAAHVFNKGQLVLNVGAILTLEVPYASRVRFGETSRLAHMSTLSYTPGGLKYKTSSYYVPGIELIGPAAALLALEPRNIIIASTENPAYTYAAGETHVVGVPDEVMAVKGCGPGLYFFMHPMDAIERRQQLAIANTVLKPGDVVMSTDPKLKMK
jgi:hypothetical protein